MNPKAILRRFLVRNSMRKGIFGGSRGWLVVGLAVFGARLFNRFVGNESRVVYSEELERGKTLVISYPGSDVELVSGKRR
jgi:hypothetical protein